MIFKVMKMNDINLKDATIPSSPVSLCRGCTGSSQRGRRALALASPETGTIDCERNLQLFGKKRKDANHRAWSNSFLAASTLCPVLPEKIFPAEHIAGWGQGQDPFFLYIALVFNKSGKH